MIRLKCIYYSKINDLLVRVEFIDKALSLAMVKHHDKDIEQEEVSFDDLIAVGKEEVSQYMGWK